MALLKLVPSKTDVKFLRFRMIAAIVSSLAILASGILFFSQGLNFGIDFRGGTKITFTKEEKPDVSRVRQIIGDLGFGDVKVQEFGSDNGVQIVIEGAVEEGSSKESERATQNVATIAQEAITAEFGDGVTFLGVEVVGPKVSGELVFNGILAVVAAVALMLVYIWFRFEWQFSLGAVIALIHDVILTIGVFSLTQLEFNLSIIAAILTIVGYSMNDTVVVYDRVRENLRKFKKMDLVDLLDLSINDTLSRTIMTSVTTLLALVSLYVFGSDVIKGFTFAMIWGIFVGTYSSIFIAAPFLTLTGVKRDWSAEGAKQAAKASS